MIDCDWVVQCTWILDLGIHPIDTTNANTLTFHLPHVNISPVCINSRLTGYWICDVIILRWRHHCSKHHAHKHVLIHRERCQFTSKINVCLSVEHVQEITWLYNRHRMLRPDILLKCSHNVKSWLEFIHTAAFWFYFDYSIFWQMAIIMKRNLLGLLSLFAYISVTMRYTRRRKRRLNPCKNAYRFIFYWFRIPMHKTEKLNHNAIISIYNTMCNVMFLNICVYLLYYMQCHVWVIQSYIILP